MNDSDSLSDALQTLNSSKLQIAFVVSESGRLSGAFTDGDFRRWILLQERIDLSLPVVECMNSSVTYLHESETHEHIERILTERLKYLPIVDDAMAIVAVASRQKQSISFGKHSVSITSPCFTIAEIGNNHNGDIALAKNLIDLAKEAGADCVKFQMRDMATLYGEDSDAANYKEDLGSQYILDLLSRFQLKNEEFIELFEYCKQQDITFLCTPFDEVSADKLVAMGVVGFKIASADLTNHALLKHVARKNLPMLVSTGMASDQEIKDAVYLLRSEAAQFILLHCNSTYPAPFKDIQLPYLKQLSKLNAGLIGYSGHERGISVAIAAVALGAKVLEKHFTIDRNMEGNDHKVSLLPDEFKQMVKAVRQVEQAMLGNGNRLVSQGEMMNRESLAKSVVAKKSIDANQIIERHMLMVQSPGKGLAPYHLEKLVGLPAARNMSKNDFFFPSDLQPMAIYKPRNYQFQQPFGIPVRYHDTNLSLISNFDIVEYHLSYQDLKLDPEHYLSINGNMKLVVHAPELFEGDHTLDLASEDFDYYQKSIQNLNDVFDLVRKLKRFYPKTKNVPVVVNVGGFTDTHFLNKEQRLKRYDIVAKNLKVLDTDQIDILIQTMPPYPWHFGGQRFHNLFVDPNEIADFCEANNTFVCFDVSHSYLACNKYDFEITEFFRLLGKYTKHLHIADAAGVDDEGLKIGEGEMDFQKIFALITEYCSSASWIPEIWQGHKNNGEGFWQALDSLEEITKSE
ncbi:N-acetylneuraminate synthase family protein [Paraglaciecola polaris]|uniref:N-acetylneuraminate synthase family protein n=1 Tax=Paraglaciecola polaris TaxID=222814 RepID=UPI0030EED01A